MQRRAIAPVAAIFLVLVAGFAGVAAAAENGTDDGQQTAEKNDVMQLVVEDPSALTPEERRRVVSWLLEPGNIDKLSGADRQAVQNWLDKAEQQGVEIPSRDAVERALENAESGGSSDREGEQQKNYDQSCESSLSNSLCITNETWTKDGDGWEVTFTFKADYPHQILITDSGAAFATDDGKPMPTRDFTVSSGYTRVTMDVTNPDEVKPTVTVSGGGTILPYSAPTGDGSLWDFITDPDTSLIQYGVVSGGIGVLLDVILVFVYLKRREKNKWYDLHREKYISPPLIRGDEDDERAEKARKTVAAHKTKLALVAAAALYAGAVLLGQAPAPGDVWSSLGNKSQLIIIGTAVASGLFVLPVYLIINHWQTHNHVYFLDFDAEDAVDSVLNKEEGIVAMYRGTPELASDLDVLDGSTTKLRTTKGRCILGTNFDPTENVAEGTLPDLHDDREVAIKGKSAIHSNKNHLKDEVRKLRQLLFRVVGISVEAETQSARRVATEVEEQLSAGSTVAADNIEEIFDENVDFGETAERGTGDGKESDGGSVGEEDTPDGE